MKTKLWLRALSLLLCLLLCVQCCTFVAAAETETETSAPEEPAPVVEGELTEKRTANEKYFMRSDQSILAAVYPNAVHYQDTDGNWQEIDNRLQESETDGVTELGNTAGPWSVKFAKKAKDGKLARLQYGDAKLSWSLNGAVKTTGQLPEIANETPEDPLVLSGVTSGVRYEGILPEVDLEYLLIGDQIKENIILNSADAPGSFTFTYNTGAATMTLTDNVITLWEGETALLSLNAPIMTDAAGNSSGAITLSLQTVKANEGNHVYTVTVTPDAAWLQMAGRVYPVTVDPTLTTPQEQSKIFDTYTDSSNPTVNYNNEKTLKVGVNGSQIFRTYLNFTLPTAIGKSDRVVSAALQLYPDASQSNWENMQSQGFTVQAYALTQSWMAENVTAGANVPSHDATIVDYLLTPATPLTNGEVSPCYWDITQMVDEWYFTGNNYGVMLKADKESGYTGNCVAQFASSTYDLFAENNHLAYPTVRIIYLNMLGLEDYWTYRALDAGVAGTAYINDFTGGLSIVTPLAAVDSAHTPLNVSLVYAPESNDPNINALKVGNHFMLNLQCYVKPVTIGGVQKYKYVDSDGTVHYFEDENGEWKDDSGLGLTITVSEDYYTIRDKKDNIMEFYADTGRLCKIKDSVGNITQLYYTVQDGKYYLSSVTNGTHTITFERENNNTGSRVYRIHYPDPDSADGKRFVQFTYTPSNSNIYHLTQYVKQNGIEKPTHIVNYSCSNNLVDQIISCPYDAENTPDSLSGTTLIFDYNTVGEGTARRRRITAYRMAAHANGELEKKQTPEGEVVNWRYYYDVSYHHRATRYTSRIKTDGGTYNNELYLFDSSGRTISVQDQDGHAAYQEHGISGGAKNKVTFASDTQRHVANLLKNHGFESGNATNLSGWEKLGGSSDNAAIKGTTENEPTYVGNKAMKVYKNSATQSIYSQVGQAVTLQKGKKYTLSAYVYTDFTTLGTGENVGAFLCIETSDWSPQIYRHNIISDGKWTRQFVTIDLTNADMAATETFNVYLGIEYAKGSAYFDGVQLEEGGAVNHYNLVENTHFTDNTTAWTGTYLTSEDKVVTETVSGDKALRLIGNSKTAKKLVQTINVTGRAGDGLTAGAYVRNLGLPNKDTQHDGTKQDCSITLEICHADGSSQFVTQSVENGINHWQYVSFGAVADENYTQLKLYLKFIYNSNKAYFDNIGLYKDAFGQSYTYDANGNVISVVDLANNTENIVANGNNDITSYKDGEENEYTFEYDGGDTSVKKHLLTKVTNPIGTTTETTYNSNGLATQNEITSGNLIMRSSTTYTDGNHQVLTETDSAQITTAYYREDVIGRLVALRTQTADEAVYLSTDYEYDPLTKEIVSIYAGHYDKAGGYLFQFPINVGYTYDRGLLTDIVRNAGDAKQMGYHMTYDAVGQRTGVYWSGKNDTQHPLQTTTYKPFGAVDTVTYGNGQTLSYTYNNAGLVTEKAYNNTTVAKYDYNNASAVGTAAYYRPHDAKWETTSYFYDLAGRVSETRDTRGYTVNGLVYDKNNNLTAYQSGVKDEHINLAYNTKYTYNKLNALTKMSFNVPGGYDSGTLRYGYDGLGRLTAKKSVLVAEDESTTAVEEKGLITTFTYKTATDSNGDTLRTLQPSTTHITDDYNGTVDVKYYDTYYADGSLKRSRITENGTHRYTYYTYDTLGQLIKQYSSYDLNTYNYTYDDGGNLTGKSYVVDTDTVYSATYTYDSNLSDLLTAYTKTEDGVTTTRTYTYNTNTDGNNAFVNPLSITETVNGVTTTKALTWREGRTLESITTPDGTIEYEYNDNGLRISRRTAAGDTYLYHYNGSQLEYIEMLDANGNLTNTLRYIYNSGGQAEYILHSPAAYANKPGVYSLYYILRDNTGSIHKLIRVRKPNSAATGVQTVVETAVEYKYDPYGKLLSTTGTDSIATLNPLIYKDYLYDSDTGWYYLQSRYYDPELGRFVNGDRLLLPNIFGTNLFTYCNNDPINYYDPTRKNLAYVWLSTMWWLPLTDAVLPVTDIVYFACAVVLGFCGYFLVDSAPDLSETSNPTEPLENDKQSDSNNSTPTPDVPYPGDDPAKAPPGYEWRGKGEAGSGKGNFYNPETKESLHPDLDHPPDIGPHWDYNFKNSGNPKGWRIFPNGKVVSKYGFFIGFDAIEIFE